MLEEGVGWENLVGQPSTQVPGILLVEAGHPERSYLWHKLQGRAAVGDLMPRTLFGPRRLPERELELYRRWIEAGAPRVVGQGSASGSAAGTAVSDSGRPKREAPLHPASGAAARRVPSPARLNDVLARAFPRPPARST